MMTEDRNTTAAERIAAHLDGRSDDIAEQYERLDLFWDDDSVTEDAREILWALPLSVETVRTIKVLLSTGGPADGIKIELDSEGNVSNVRYWFADWFDYADADVTKDSPLWRFAEDIAETHTDSDR